MPLRFDATPTQGGNGSLRFEDTTPTTPPKKGIWDTLNEPLTDLPSRVAHSVMEPMVQWGETHPGMVGDAARIGGTFGESVGNVASGLTSPVNLGLSAATLGAGTAEKMGMSSLAKTLTAPSKIAAAVQTGHGLYSMSNQPTMTGKALGGVEALLGVLGLRGGVKSGEPAPTSDNTFVVEPTTHTGPGTSEVSFKNSGKVDQRIPTKNRVITGNGDTNVVPQPSSMTSSGSPVPYGHGEVPSAPEEVNNLGDAGLSPTDQTRQISRDQANLAKVQKWYDKNQATKDAASNIAEMKQGLEPQPPTVTESYKAGPYSASQRYVEPKVDVPSLLKVKAPGPTNPVQSFADLLSPPKDRFADILGPEGPQGVIDQPGVGTLVPDVNGSHTLVTPTVEPQAPVVEPSLPSPGDESSPLLDMLKGKKGGRSKSAKTVEGWNAQFGKNVDAGGLPPDVPSPTPPAPPLEAPTPPIQTAPTPRGGLYDSHPEVAAEADRLGELYRNGDKNAGKQLGDLARFMKPNPKMQKNWRGAVEAPSVGEPSPLVNSKGQSIAEQVAANQGGSGIQSQEAGPLVGTDSTTPEMKSANSSNAREMTPEEIQAEHDWIDRLKGQKGTIAPELMGMLGRAGVGAVTGGIAGGAMGHPFLGAALGAGTGALTPQIVAHAQNAVQALQDIDPRINQAGRVINRAQNTGLFGPASVLKKGLGDVGNMALAGLEHPENWRGLARTLSGEGWPEAIAAGKEAFHAPFNDEGDISGIEETLNKGPLSYARRAMGATTAGAKSLLGQSGFTPEQQDYYTMQNQPETALGEGVMDASRKAPIISHISPALKLGINKIESGYKYSPLGLITDRSKDSLKKAALGSAAGYLANQLTPEDYVKNHPEMAPLIGALGGRLGIPIAIGMAMSTSAHSPIAQAAKVAGKDVPGFQLLQDATSSPDQLVKNYLSRYTNSVKPLAEFLSPPEPDTSGNVFPTKTDEGHPLNSLLKAESNVPGLRGSMPIKKLTYSKLRFD